MSTRRTRTQPEPAGTVVVLGAGLDGGAVPAVLASRLEQAAALYRAGAAAGRPPVLVLSGGATADGGPTEAAAMAAHLGLLGVPAGDLLLEERSTTTQENLAHSAALLAGRGLAAPVVVVTSDFHVRRVAALARRAGLRVAVVGAPTPAALRVPAALREAVLLLGLHAEGAAAGVHRLLRRRR